MIGQIEVEIEASEVALLLLLDFVDVKLREKHAAFRMVRVGEREEAGRPRVLLADLLGRHFGQRLPCDAGGEFRPDALLDGFAARHGYARRGFVAEIITLGQQIGLSFSRSPLSPISSAPSRS